MNMHWQSLRHEIDFNLHQNRLVHYVQKLMTSSASAIFSKRASQTEMRGNLAWRRCDSRTTAVGRRFCGLQPAEQAAPLDFVWPLLSLADQPNVVVRSNDAETFPAARLAFVEYQNYYDYSMAPDPNCAKSENAISKDIPEDDVSVFQR
jgi:hypothetical protein